MERTTSPELLSRFADAIESNGIELVPTELLADLVRAGRAVDASPIAIDVLVDPTEPWVARERAFGLLATQILGRDGRTDNDRNCGRMASTTASGMPRPLAPTSTSTRRPSTASA